ncbi:MAG TPA: glycosyltransferase family 4 protein [Acidimicrobiia bacterium]|nr:glycosyltransferase family 4 protein [Acidimicrobiia bacterium]
MSVIHILPYDLDRGAQRYARALVDSLDSPRQPHLILTLFAADPVVLRADIELGVPRGVLRRLGIDPRVILRLRKALRESRPEVVVAHGGEPAKYVAMAVPRNLPVVYLSIGSAHPNLRRTMSRALHRWYTRRADLVVAVSNEVATEAKVLHGIPEERVVVIPNGRDAAVFRPGERREGPVRLIFVGHLDAGKRPERFVELVADLRRRGDEIEARMVGEGPLVDEIRPAAEAAGVLMMGRRDDVPRLMAESDLMVLTSRPPEGMPGVLIEAGLSGLAAVSTRIPGSADVIDDGVTGVLVDVDDFPALVEAAHSLVTDPERRIEMGRRARALCLERFTFEATSDRWRAVLGSLVDRRPIA